MRYLGVAVIAQNQDGDIILHLRDGNTSRMTNQWCLIGGHIDAGEDLSAAAQREVLEETGLTLVNPKQIGDLSFGDKQSALLYGTVSGTQNDLVLGEGAELRFIHKSDVAAFISALPYSNPCLDALTDFVSHKQDR